MSIPLDQNYPPRALPLARSLECRHDEDEAPKKVTAPVTPRRLLSILTSAERKEYPITTGFLDYFPDATAMVAHVSYLGNQKHNPGQPTHWARGKSMDHEDCIVRHTIERDVEEDGVLHAANRAWRAMAALQEMCEKKYNLDPPRGAHDATDSSGTCCASDNERG